MGATWEEKILNKIVKILFEKKSALAPGLFFCPPIPAVLMVQDFLIKIMMNDFLKDIANIVLF